MSDNREDSKRSDKDAFGVPFHLSELKALHPDCEVVEFERAPRFAIVIRPQIDAEVARKFVSDLHARGIEVMVFCLGNAKALPEGCVFGNVLESM